MLAFCLTVYRQVFQKRMDGRGFSPGIAWFPLTIMLAEISEIFFSTVQNTDQTDKQSLGYIKNCQAYRWGKESGVTALVAEVEP